MIPVAGVVRLVKEREPPEPGIDEFIQRKVRPVAREAERVGDARAVVAVEVELVRDEQKALRVFQDLRALQKILAPADVKPGGEVPPVKAAPPHALAPEGVVAAVAQNNAGHLPLIPQDLIAERAGV